MGIFNPPPVPTMAPSTAPLTAPPPPVIPAGMTDQEAIMQDKKNFEADINMKIKDIMSNKTKNKYKEKLKQMLVEQIAQILKSKGLNPMNPKDAQAVMEFMNILPPQVQEILGLTEPSNKLGSALQKVV